MLIEPFRTILRLFQSMAYVVEFQTGNRSTPQAKVDRVMEQTVDDLPSPISSVASPTASTSSTDESSSTAEGSIESSATTLSFEAGKVQPIIAGTDPVGPDASSSIKHEAPIVDTPMLETPTALAEEIDILPPKRPSEDLAREVLEIIRRYEHNTYARTGIQNAGEKFLPLIESYIEKNERIKMVLPAFPCVSPIVTCYSLCPEALTLTCILIACLLLS